MSSKQSFKKLEKTILSTTSRTIKVLVETLVDKLKVVMWLGEIKVRKWDLLANRDCKGFLDNMSWYNLSLSLPYSKIK